MEERRLVAIVPNFSEGRRQDVVDAIVGALRVPGVVLANRQADPDHNRLDCTLIGPPDAVRRSALAGAAKAVELIDMEEHRGSHPRIGAVDVIPFVPVRGVTMRECVRLARSLAEEVAHTLGLPVYCYGEAALRPERGSLADVRRGEYEGLREAVARGERLPDFGPREIGRAGAVAVGARKPLIAFNVYLSGGAEGAAGEIARAVRESSHGLRAVRAIGFAVPDRELVTVSMNLVDFEVTSPRRAFDAVAEQAARRGMEVVAGEIVGLVPEAALAGGDVSYLRLEGFDAEEQILERVVSRAGAGFRSMAVEGFLERLASVDATPGGGAAASIAGAAGAALVSMVSRLTEGKKGFEDVSALMGEVVRQADDARAEFLDLADRDAAAFDEVMAAFKLPKGTKEERASRAEEIQRAYAGAAEAPLDIARLAARMIDLAVQVTEVGNPNAASDGASAAHLLAAAARCALANVEINAASLEDAGLAGRLRTEAGSIRARVDEGLVRAGSAFRGRISEG